MIRYFVLLVSLFFMTGCFNNDINVVKDAVIDRFSKTITVGQALDSWAKTQKCDSTVWESAQTDRGENIVRFICKIESLDTLDEIWLTDYSNEINNINKEITQLDKEYQNNKKEYEQISQNIRKKSSEFANAMQKYKDEKKLVKIELEKKIDKLNSKINLLEKEVEALDIKRNKKEIKMTEYSKIAHPLKVELNYAKNDKMREEQNLRSFNYSTISQISDSNEKFSNNLYAKQDELNYSLKSTKEKLDKLKNQAIEINAINKSLEELKSINLVVEFILSVDKEDFFINKELQTFIFKDGKQFTTSVYGYGIYSSILISAYRNDFFKIVEYDTSYFEERK